MSSHAKCAMLLLIFFFRICVCASFRNSWAAANGWHLDVHIFFTNQHFECGSCFDFDHEPFTKYGDSIAFAVATSVSGDEIFS